MDHSVYAAMRESPTSSPCGQAVLANVHAHCDAVVLLSQRRGANGRAPAPLRTQARRNAEAITRDGRSAEAPRVSAGAKLCVCATAPADDRESNEAGSRCAGGGERAIDAALPEAVTRPRWLLSSDIPPAGPARGSLLSPQ